MGETRIGTKMGDDDGGDEDRDDDGGDEDRDEDGRDEDRDDDEGDEDRDDDGDGDVITLHPSVYPDSLSTPIAAERLLQGSACRPRSAGS